MYTWTTQKVVQSSNAVTSLISHFCGKLANCYLFKFSLSTVASQDDNDLLVNGGGVSPLTQWQSFTSLTHIQVQCLSVMETHAYTHCQAQTHAIILSFPRPALSLSPSLSLKHTRIHSHFFTKSVHLNTELLLFWKGRDGGQAVEWERRRGDALQYTLRTTVSLSFTMSICLSVGQD